MPTAYATRSSVTEGSVLVSYKLELPYHYCSFLDAPLHPLLPGMDRATSLANRLGEIYA